jgi:hypothetical protein
MPRQWWQRHHHHSHMKDGKEQKVSNIPGKKWYGKKKANEENEIVCYMAASEPASHTIIMDDKE